jgi:hypothetical protein
MFEINSSLKRAALIAPLCSVPAVLLLETVFGGVTALMSGKLWGALFTVLLCAYTMTLLFGIPAFLLLQYFEKLTYMRLLFMGCLGGALTLTIISPFPSWSGLLVCCYIAAVVTTGFWWCYQSASA